MKNITTVVTLLCIVVGLSSVSCKKKADPVVPTGGLGGTATLLIYPQHHAKAYSINTCKVYIKYNASDAPATYDDSAICICADSIVSCTFTNLKNGNYYLYGYGYDTVVHYTVAGGLGVSISTQGATTNVALPITEI